ncbi:MAG: hypothetical protein QM728_09535 [Gordonia sp. (in: high G+C Gram-positive bacteria)]|uniref:hypothetical protein n=1 Tax=Gordonia sp. (in: high G+C Gram-positive bacteria) TaxID=84139 RepID=UPI0039E56D6D
MRHAYRSDPVRTARRIARYDDYTSQSILAAGGEFVCAHGPDCLSAARANDADCAFYEGQLGYIGDNYDLTIDGHPWRMAVVGMELGGKPPLQAHVRRAERTAHHNLVIDPASPTRNPHMRGTRLALNYCFGLPLQAEEIDLEGRPESVFTAYSLLNARLCSATTKPNSMDSAGVSTMTHNCFDHLSEILRILQPTLVLIQGVGVWRELADQIMVDGERVGENLVVSPAFGDPPTMIAHFTHPSARGAWGWSRADAPYFVETVVPTLRAAVERSWTASVRDD